MVTYNDNSSAGNSSGTSLDSRSLIPATVLSICFLLGFLGNIAVMILKPNWENMSSLSQSLMLNLAVSDLLCMLTIPLWTYSVLNSWTFGVEACKLVTYLGYCSVYGSLLTVTAMSIQRYLQVVFPQVGASLLLVPLWLSAMILSIPALVVRQLVEQPHWFYCKHQYFSEGQSIAVLLTEILVGFVLFSIIVFSYTSIYRKVNRAAFFNNQQTTRVITSIIVTFFGLWMPYLAINVIAVAAISLKNKSLLKFCEDTWNAVGTLTFLSSTMNPLLYTFTSIHLSTLGQRIGNQLRRTFRNRSQSRTVTAGAAPH
uniref:G-protein coupled receptors family 1 profile domain-containing protein n=1 Tax=Neolamprologus brichardi TaxID=32507 RepID=A0A3Q4I3F6_NEOBR